MSEAVATIVSIELDPTDPAEPVVLVTIVQSPLDGLRRWATSMSIEQATVLAVKSDRSHLRGQGGRGPAACPVTAPKP